STAPTAAYPLSLHDALPIYRCRAGPRLPQGLHELAAGSEALRRVLGQRSADDRLVGGRKRRQVRRLAHVLHQQRSPALAVERPRSEEHTSELQSLTNLVCRL